jgi:hypothetical protein
MGRPLLRALPFMVFTIATPVAQVVSPPEPATKDAVQVSGCLRLWDSSIGALPGQATGPRYVLMDARQDDNPGKSVIVLRRYVVTAEPAVNLAGHIDQTVRISGRVSGSPTTVTLPAPGEITPRPGAPVRPADNAVRPPDAAQPNDPPVRPGEAARAGQIPAPVTEPPDDDSAWLALTASSVTGIRGSCAPPR